MAKRSQFDPVRHCWLVAGILLLSGCGGGSSKLEYYENKPGNFRALVAGKPAQSQETVSSPAGQLAMNSIETVDRDQIRRVVVYTELPAQVVQASDPDALLDGGIRGMGASSQWTVESQGPVSLDGHPGREIRFAVNSPRASQKGAGKARIFLIGNRLYQAIVVGPASKVNEEELDHFVKSFELLQKVPPTVSASNEPVAPQVETTSPTLVAQSAPPPAQPEEIAPAVSPPVAALAPAPAPDPAPPPTEAPPPTATRVPPQRQARVAPPAATQAEGRTGRIRVKSGSAGRILAKRATIAIDVKEPAEVVVERPLPSGNPADRFRVVAPERGVLVGMRVGYIDAFGGPKVGAIQPIFQVGKNYVEGQAFGKAIPASTTVVARPGYAVGAINTHTGLLLDAFQIVFMRFKDGVLDTGDSYATDWLGDPRGGGAGTATSEGKLVVGVHGRTNGREINALGLLIAE
jgi:hypothetical protein